MNIDSSGVGSAQAAQQGTPARQLAEAGTTNTSTAPVQTVSATTESVQQTSTADQASVNIEDLQEAVQKMNQLMESNNRSLQFSVDDSTEAVVIKVVDLDTDEVVRQIPSEETLKFSEFLEGMVGLIFDERA